MSKIWSMAAFMVLLTSLFSLASPVLADTPSWSAEPIPSTDGNILGPVGIDIRDLAVAADGVTIYAVPGDSVSDNVIYRSDDSGMSWAALEVAIEADLVSVAPDDALMVAIARKNEPAVYVTYSGGQNWHSLGTIRDKVGTAAAALYDIAISAASGGVRYVAVAGKEAGDVANVWYLQTGQTTPVWQETNTMPGLSSANMMGAVMFSPNFPSDRVMVAVGESDRISVNFEILSLASQKWNASAGFENYPVAVVSDGGIADLSSASISLAPDYLGGDSARRVAFVGLTVNGDTAAKATSGIYRLENTSQKELETGVSIHSIAFDGINLVAGAYDSNSAYWSNDPRHDLPDVSLVSSLKSPGGENRVVVAWTGSSVVAGTSGDESAFAVSGNDGRSFNDTSLIDTTLAELRDVAASADSNRVYLVSDDGTDLSLWRKASSWVRILSRRNTTNYIIRLAPEDEDVVYLAEKDAKTIYWTRDGGETEWSLRPCNIDIQDLAVESADVVYALSQEGEVVKSTSAGIIWEEAESTELDEDTGYMIVSVGEDKLLVGSTDGYVAYSTDGNSSWKNIPRVLQQGAGNVQVIADENFATNKIIYAASDKPRQDIKRWKLGTSGDWVDIFKDVVAGGIYGLVVDGSSLYALEFNPKDNQSTLWQCLIPAKATAGSGWDSRKTTTSTDITDQEVFFNVSPQALRIGSGSKLWAIKTNGTNRLYSITDIMTRLGLETPELGFTNPVNRVTGIASEVTFGWERLLKATEYELYLALDEDFTQLITKLVIESESSTVRVMVGPNREGNARVDFSAGTTYYWRVRITEPLYNLYSETWSFNNETLTMAPPVVIERPPPPVLTVPPAPAVEIPFPEIKLPPPPPSTPEIVIPSAPAPLAPITPAYVWAIIGIGAVLVLAVIALILMTFVNRFLIWWLQKVRYRWSRLRRKFCETKYLSQSLPMADSLSDIEACLAQVTWTVDGPLHLFDAISYPQTVWAKKKDDCDGFAILAAALLQRWDASSRPVLLTAMLRPMRRSHTVCGFSVPGAGIWFFDNGTLRRGHFRTYADIVTEIEGKARLVCWDVVDPNTLQAIEFHTA